MAGGSYPGQRLTAVSKGSSTHVFFRPAPGASVTLNGSLTIDGADHLTIAGPLTVNGELFSSANSYSDDVTVANLTAHRFDLQAVSNWLIEGGSYGAFSPNDDPNTTADNYANNKIEEYGGLLPQNVTVEGVTIHDEWCVPSNCHAEGLFLWRTRNVTIRDSRFYNNDFYDIFFAGGDDSGAVIENNWFDDPYVPNSNGTTRSPAYGRGTAIQWKNGGSYSNMLVRFNSFNQYTGLSFDGSGGSFVRAVGNLLEATDCGSAAYSYNIFTRGNGGASCGSNALTVSSFPYLNGGHGATLDYHLSGGAPVDFVPGATGDQQLADDIDHQARPMGPARDAGSDELR